MNKKAIHLGQPLEILIQRALALPRGDIDDENVVKTMRHVYELARGRSVETSIGRIPIAPPVVPGLATACLHAATRSELVSLIERKIASINNPAHSRNIMKDLTVHITPHDLKLSTRLREFVCRKIAGISRFCGDLLSAEVVLRGPSGAAHLFSVSARLALPGRDVQANAAHSNPYGAINKLVERLGRLSRKRKTRLTKTARQLGKKRSKRLPDQSSLLYAL